MAYTPPERNFRRVQFQDIRELIDIKYNSVHDELTDCYYGKKPFRNYGVLSKETFDELHGLIFYMRDIEFDDVNRSRPAARQYATSRYDDVLDDKGQKADSRIQRAKNFVRQCREKGLVLEI